MTAISFFPIFNSNEQTSPVLTACHWTRGSNGPESRDWPIQSQWWIQVCAHGLHMCESVGVCACAHSQRGQPEPGSLLLYRFCLIGWASLLLTWKPSFLAKLVDHPVSGSVSTPQSRSYRDAHWCTLLCGWIQPRNHKASPLTCQSLQPQNPMLYRWVL